MHACAPYFISVFRALGPLVLSLMRTVVDSDRSLATHLYFANLLSDAGIRPANLLIEWPMMPQILWLLL